MVHISVLLDKIFHTVFLFFFFAFACVCVCMVWTISSSTSVTLWRPFPGETCQSRRLQINQQLIMLFILLQLILFAAENRHLVSGVCAMAWVQLDGLLLTEINLPADRPGVRGADRQLHISQKETHQQHMLKNATHTHTLFFSYFFC